MHDTDWGTPLTADQQFELEFANYVRWAPGPLKSRESARATFNQLHDTCPDCATEAVA